MILCIVAAVSIFLSQFYACRATEKFNVFDKIKSGFKMAGDFFSSDHASKVANLVSKALGGKSTPGKPEEKSNNIFSGFLRLFGFESRQISAIAVNAIILVAQLIGSSLNPSSKLDHQKSSEDTPFEWLLKNPSSKLDDQKSSEDTPFEWLLKNDAISDIMMDTKDQSLSEKAIDYVTERSLDEETGCVQLLICKMKPFISEMQRALRERGRSGVKGYNVLFEYFPNASTIADNGEKCEKKYYYCSIPL